MSLGQEQELFSVMLGKLLVWCSEQGIPVRIGDVFARDGHKAGSNHYLKLAADLYVFRSGSADQDMEAHKRMHDAWDALGGAPRIEKDMNHYSIKYQGRW